TRVAQTGQTYDRLAQPQPGARRQVVQLEAGGQHVLAQVAGRELVTQRARLVEELDGEQVHLAQVRGVRRPSLAGAVLHRGARVCVADDPEVPHQGDRVLRLLAEPVLVVPAHGDDPRVGHGPQSRG